MSKVKLYCAFPSTGKRVEPQIYVMRRLEEKYKDKIEFVYPSVFVSRIFHDFARNALVEEFLKTDCDILWFLDSDVSPPDNILDLITEHGDSWKLAGAPYPVFMTPTGLHSPQVLYTVYSNTGKGFQPATVPESGTGFVEGIATGCIFIRREILEAMDKPYFEFKYDPETRQLIEGEDLGFCKKMHQIGHKFFIDYSLVCDHFKEVSLLSVNNYAMQYAQNQVLAYDRGLRSSIAKSKLGLSK